jgi:hypothetical protein
MDRPLARQTDATSHAGGAATTRQWFERIGRLKGALGNPTRTTVSSHTHRSIEVIYVLSGTYGHEVTPEVKAPKMEIGGSLLR